MIVRILSLAITKTIKEPSTSPLDGKGNYIDTSILSKGQKEKFNYSLSYKMANLLHISRTKDYLVFMGSKVCGARSHDKVLGKDLIDDFVKNIGSQKIKLLITDRAFLDAKMISDFKNRYGIDVFSAPKKEHASLD